jgi:hypothetical protein
VPRNKDSARERGRRYREKARIAKYGPDCIGVDMRGKNPKPKGGLHPRFTGGVTESEHGYIKVRVGEDHPLADPNGYAYLHLIVWCSSGRERPPPGYTLHHKNEVKADNRIENLDLLHRPDHGTTHIRTRKRGDDGRLLDEATPNEFPQARA